MCDNLSYDSCEESDTESDCVSCCDDRSEAKEQIIRSNVGLRDQEPFFPCEQKISVEVDEKS